MSRPLDAIHLTDVLCVSEHAPLTRGFRPLRMAGALLTLMPFTIDIAVLRGFVCTAINKSIRFDGVEKSSIHRFSLLA